VWLACIPPDTPEIIPEPRSSGGACIYQDAWERSQFSNADVVGLITRTARDRCTASPRRTSEGAAHGAGTASPSTLVRSAWGATGCERAVTTTLHTQPSTAAAIAEPKCTGFHESFPRRTERQGRPCHSSTRYCSANKRGWCIPGCSACSWSSASNAITLAGVRQRHGETYGDWQSSGVLAEYLDESRCDDVLIRSSHVVAGDAPNEPWHRRYPSLMPANSLPVIRRHRRTRPGSRPRKATT
jgi:hypothetical protein